MTEVEHFRRYFADYKKLGIYGAGHYGQLLFKFVSQLDINIKVYYIDDYKSGSVSGLEIIKPHVIPADTDLIVVALSDMPAAAKIAHNMSEKGIRAGMILLNNRLLDSIEAMKNATGTQTPKPAAGLLLKLKKFDTKRFAANYLQFTIRRLFHSLLISLNVLLKPGGGVRDNCPVCGGKTDFLLRNIFGYKIHECKSCTHTFVANTPDKNIMRRLYSGCDYYEIDREHQGITSLKDNSQWKDFIAARIKWINLFDLLNGSRGESLRILEIGCLEGKLLHHLAKNGHRVYGCEINKSVAALGSSAFEIEIRADALENCGFEEGFFDIILAFHVFEHFEDPLDCLQLCRRLLKKNGHILIEVPSGETDYDNLQHLHFFNEKSLGVMFNAVFSNYFMVPACYHLFDARYSQTTFVCASSDG